jgi:hypothetical protein
MLSCIQKRSVPESNMKLISFNFKFITMFISFFFRIFFTKLFIIIFIEMLYYKRMRRNKTNNVI